jgi:hypothetical protein
LKLNQKKSPLAVLSISKLAPTYTATSEITVDWECIYEIDKRINKNYTQQRV